MKKIKYEEYSKWDKNLHKELTPLEALEKIKDDMAYQIQLREDCVVVPYFGIIEAALKNEEKQNHYIEVLEDRINNVETTYTRQRKALEIIKEKNINVRGIINSPTLEHYIDHCMPRYSKEPTQEEYDLLKEVLK